ncbi:hypothetical protein BC830DRAFT_1077122 [Chytriomyces sp. MP71]|nr:hypothetical protein BC830DRAFT_1077122 [Chytriomyces sp. MP71]
MPIKKVEGKHVTFNAKCQAGMNNNDATNPQALALDVKNYPLIEQLEIEFAHGFMSEVVHKASTSTAGFVAYKNGLDLNVTKKLRRACEHCTLTYWKVLVVSKDPLTN